MILIKIEKNRKLFQKTNIRKEQTFLKALHNEN